MNVFHPAYGHDSNHHNLHRLEKTFSDGIAYLTSGQDPGLQRIFERLVNIDERNWLNQSPLIKKQPLHNSLDDNISELSLDLALPDFIGKPQLYSGFLFLEKFSELIFPTSQTFLGFLRLNYQLFHGFQDLQQPHDQRQRHIPITTFMAGFGKIIEYINTVNSDCAAPNSSNMDLIGTFRTIPCQAAPSEQMWQELFDHNERDLMDDLLTHQQDQRMEDMDLESRCAF